MTRPLADVQAPSTRDFPNKPASPGLSLYSVEAGLDGLSVMVFQEPGELESLSLPASPDIILGLYTGGAMYVERREAHGPWEGGAMRHGDLLLSWGGGAPYEARLRNLSTFPTQVLNIHLSREMVTRVAQQVAGVDLASLELVELAGFRDPLLTQVALALWREQEQPVPAGDLYAETASQLLAVHLVRQYTSSSTRPRAAPPSPPGLTDRQLRQVLEFIQTHLSEELSLDLLAQQVGFSPYHFARLFRRAMGASPHQVVRRQRLEYAQWLLRETELPLVQVASACGFGQQSYLTQVFRQQLGCTPRAYRQDRTSTRADFSQNAHDSAR